MAKNVEVKSVSIVNWIIPMFGNDHFMPYGRLLVKGYVNGEYKEQYCRTRGDSIKDNAPYQYFIFQGQRFIVINEGSLYQPKIRTRKWEKTKTEKGWVYL